MTEDKMHQEAPYPELLADLVRRVSYRPGWQCTLAHIDRGQGSQGLTLTITTLGFDSYHPDRGEHYRVHHYMPVPPAAYDRRSWQRWLFEQFLLVERHECMEFFAVADACQVCSRPQEDHLDAVICPAVGGSPVTRFTPTRPYAPSHGPGNDPYLVREVGTTEDQRTSFRGELADH